MAVGPCHQSYICIYLFYNLDKLNVPISKYLNYSLSAIFILLVAPVDFSHFQVLFFINHTVKALVGVTFIDISIDPDPGNSIGGSSEFG